MNERSREARNANRCHAVTLPPKNVPLAECFNASKENGNDEDSAGAVGAGANVPSFGRFQNADGFAAALA